MRVMCLAQEQARFKPGLEPKAIEVSCTNNPELPSLRVVKPWLPKPKEPTEHKTFKGEDVSFECAAKGFPLEVEWRVKKKNEDTIRDCISKFGSFLVLISC